MTFERLTGSTADTFLEYIQRNLPEGVAMKVTKVSPPSRRPKSSSRSSFLLDFLPSADVLIVMVINKLHSVRRVRAFIENGKINLL